TTAAMMRVRRSGGAKVRWPVRKARLIRLWPAGPEGSGGSPRSPLSVPWRTMAFMRLLDLATTSAAVSGISARSAKIALIAERLRTAAGPDEVRVAVHYLSGELPQRQIGVGWAAL